MGRDKKISDAIRRQDDRDRWEAMGNSEYPTQRDRKRQETIGAATKKASGKSMPKTPEPPSDGRRGEIARRILRK